MKSDRLGQSSSSRGGLSGSNDDSSVVSLKALVAKARPQVSAAPAAAPAATFDDSGLIDLNKLIANMPSESSDVLPPVLGVNDAGLFAMPEPTLTPQVPAASGLSEVAAENHTKGRGKWLVVGAVATVLAIVGTFGVVYARTSEQSEATAAPMTGATSESRPAAETSPHVEPTPVVTTAPVTTAEPRPEATQARPNRQAAVNAGTQSRTGREVPAVKPKPEAKPASATPCDLRCEIERAAKKQKPK